MDFEIQVRKENNAKIDIKISQNLTRFWWGGGPGHAGEEFSPSLVGGIPVDAPADAPVDAPADAPVDAPRPKMRQLDLPK